MPINTLFFQYCFFGARFIQGIFVQETAKLAGLRMFTCCWGFELSSCFYQKVLVSAVSRVCFPVIQGSSYREYTIVFFKLFNLQIIKPPNFGFNFSSDNFRRFCPIRYFIICYFHFFFSHNKQTNDEWSVCKHCEMFRPPRSHHCR